MMDPKAPISFLCFELNGMRFGIRGDSVERVLPAVAARPLPGAPDYVEGLLTVRGAVVPLVDLRARLRQPPKPVTLDDHVVMARAWHRRFAFRVDRALGIADIAPERIREPTDYVAAAPRIAGITVLADGLTLIADVDHLLSEIEAEALAGLLDRECRA